MATPRSEPRHGLVGRLIASVFFLIFFGAGVAFELMIAWFWWNEVRVYFWDETPAAIRESRVIDEEKGTPQAYVKYSYSFRGGGYSSERIAMPQTQPSAEEVYEFVEANPRGSHQVCYVNPSNPSQAVLTRGGLWFGLFGLIPLVFIAIGGVGLVGVWRKKSSASGASGPITGGRNAARHTRRVLVLVMSGFLVIGSILTYALGIAPALKVRDARSWHQVACEIVSSQVRTLSDSDGTTYRVDIVYRYSYQGSNYTGTRYSFDSSSSSGYNGKAEVVGRFPPGAQSRAYVNPRNPREAVLQREYEPGLAFGFFPLIFVLVGGVGLIATLKGRSASSPSSAGNSSFQIPSRSMNAPPRLDGGPSNLGSESKALRPINTRKAKFIGLTLFGVVWNVVIAFFVFDVVRGWSRGDGSVFETLFLLPFLAIGIAVVAGAVYQFLGMFNPEVALSLMPARPKLGEVLAINVQIGGKVHRLENIKVELEGREEATYRRGTDTRTDRAAFYRKTVLEKSAGELAGPCVTKLELPAGLMHSFVARNNKIVWLVRVKGSVPRWPDIHDEYEITVLPRKSK